jgi:hypothetical protein
MSVTFDSVTVPVAQSETLDIRPLMRETVLLSGALRVQSSTAYHQAPAFSCIGTSSEYSALVAKIGTKGSLMVNSTTATYANCYIRTIGPVTKISNTTKFTFNIGFVQDTAS